MNYFPTHLASGHAFCNRKEEITRVLYDLEMNNPILIISPRRYGKTSLALKAFETIKFPYVHVDFYKALNEADLARSVLQGVGHLLGKLETGPQKLLHLATELFNGLQVKVTLGKAGVALDFPQAPEKPIDLVLQSLEKLHELAVKKKQRVILFLDEFQVVGEITENYGLEAVLREMAQKSTQIAFVFSGSNRHLMEQMFYDKKRPFYKMCDLINLHRIANEHYTQHIQKAARAQWDQELVPQVLEQIFALTENHSYYVNKLCSLLWLQDTPPGVAMVAKIWHDLALENRSVIDRELNLLSLNQRKIMIKMAAAGRVFEPFAQAFTRDVELSSSSLHRAMEGLLEKDYVFCDESGHYRILDPLIKTVLQ